MESLREFRVSTSHAISRASLQIFHFHILMYTLPFLTQLYTNFVGWCRGWAFPFSNKNSYFPSCSIFYQWRKCTYIKLIPITPLLLSNGVGEPSIQARTDDAFFCVRPCTASTGPDVANVACLYHFFIIDGAERVSHPRIGFHVTIFVIIYGSKRSRIILWNYILWHVSIVCGTISLYWHMHLYHCSYICVFSKSTSYGIFMCIYTWRHEPFDISATRK
jgi:hypothetical protein